MSKDITQNPEPLDDHYKAVYNSEAQKYDQRSFESPQGNFSAIYKNAIIAEALVKFGANNSNRVILDCPSGTGRITHDIVSGEASFGHIYAYDISAGMLEVNKENLPAHANKVTFKAGNMKALELEDNSVDEAVIASFAYLVPASDYSDYVQDIYRVLKPDGIAVIEVSNALCAYNPVNLIKVLWHKVIQGKKVKSYVFSWQLKSLFKPFEIVSYQGSEFPLLFKSYKIYRAQSNLLGKTPILKMFSGKLTVILRKQP